MKRLHKNKKISDYRLISAFHIYHNLEGVRRGVSVNLHWNQSGQRVCL